MVKGNTESTCSAKGKTQIDIISTMVELVALCAQCLKITMYYFLPRPTRKSFSPISLLSSLIHHLTGIPYIAAHLSILGHSIQFFSCKINLILFLSTNDE